MVEGCGYRRLTALLRREGYLANKKRVLRLMQEDSLLSLRRAKYILTTDSQHDLPIYPNLTRRLSLTGLNQLWIADITYIRLRSEFVFLAVVLDAYSRRVIGWELGHSLRVDLVVNALEMALHERTWRPGALIHHSDRGVQYASREYTGMLVEHEIRISMSRRGSPYEKGYASYCTSCKPSMTFSGKRGRSESLVPWALRGGSGPGSSYRNRFLSLTR